MIQNFPGPQLLLNQHIVVQCYAKIYLVLSTETEKLHTVGIVAKRRQNCIRNEDKNNKCEDLSVSMWQENPFNPYDEPLPYFLTYFQLANFID